MDGVAVAITLLVMLAGSITLAVLAPTPRKRLRAAMKRYGFAHHKDAYGHRDEFEGELPEGRVRVRTLTHLPAGESPLEVTVGGALPALGEAAAFAIAGYASGWRYAERAWHFKGGEVDGAAVAAVVERGRELARALSVALPMSLELRMALADASTLRAARGTTTWDEAAAIVRSDVDPEVRLRVARRMAEPSLLVELACATTAVGERALDELIQLAAGGAEVVQVLDWHVARRDGMDARTLQRVAVALRRCAYARADEVLGAMLAHADEEVRLTAAESLRVVGTVAAVPALRRLAERAGTSEHVAGGAIAAIQSRAEGAAAGGLALVEAGAEGGLALVPEA